MPQLHRFASLRFLHLAFEPVQVVAASAAAAAAEMDGAMKHALEQKLKIQLSKEKVSVSTYLIIWRLLDVRISEEEKNLLLWASENPTLSFDSFSVLTGWKEK